MMMRVNATACKVKVQEHLNDIVQDTGYGGYSSVTCFSKIQGLYSGPVRCPKGLKGDDGDLLHGTGKPFQNEFLTMKYGTASALVFHRNGMLYRIRDTQLCGWITPKNAIQKAVDQVYEVLDKMGIKAAVAAFPDKICLDSVKNADDAIRELQNIIDYVREAKELIGEFKKQKSEKPTIVDVNKLMKNMSFKGGEETQV